MTDLKPCLNVRNTHRPPKNSAKSVFKCEDGNTRSEEVIFDLSGKGIV